MSSPIIYSNILFSGIVSFRLSWNTTNISVGHREKSYQYGIAQLLSRLEKEGPESDLQKDWKYEGHVLEITKKKLITNWQDT